MIGIDIVPPGRAHFIIPPALPGRASETHLLRVRRAGARICANMRGTERCLRGDKSLQSQIGGPAATSGRRKARPQTAPRMGLLSELRYPTRWYTQLISAALALIFFALLSTATPAGFLLYRMVAPARSRADINLRDLPVRPEVVPFTIPGVGQREGWFFPGLKTAPTIILCHGYQSQRGELLTLVSALQDNQYNVFLFDFAGHGSSPGLSTFGYREVEELHGAIAAVARRSDVDRTRFGLWGANLGAYAVVGVAAVDSRVGAFVVDSVYERPEDMVRLRVQRSG